MLIFILFSILRSLYCHETAVETVNFQIIHKNQIIGQFTAQKSRIGNLTLYQSNSSLITNAVPVQISYQFKVVLKEGVLEEADLKMMVNGRLKTHSQTIKDGEIYTFYKSGKAKSEIRDIITHTTIMLYFGEPLGIERTYSEEKGNFCEILPSANNTYQKINAKGKKSTYQYHDNLLNHLFIATTMMDFEMICI